MEGDFVVQIVNYLATLLLVLSVGYVIRFYVSYSPTEYDPTRKKFNSKFSNFLYKISFKPPFSFFVEDEEGEEISERVEKVKKLIILSNSSNLYDVRTFVTLKTFLFACVVIAFFGNIFFLMNAEGILSFIAGLDRGTVKNVDLFTAFQQSLTLLMVISVVPLLPSMKMKNKVQKIKIEKDKDLPVLQIFLILFLRANKTIEEMLFSMSKLNTAYKNTFEQAYRISTRDKREAIKHLKQAFENETFIESLDVLKDLQDYAKDDCVKIMESNLVIITNELETNKRQADLSSLVYSQAAIAIPFAAVLLLAGAPIAQYAINIISNLGVAF
jgi:hypothetical protein